jgi:integrase
MTALKWTNINLNDGFILIKQSNYKLPGESTKSKAPKTKKSVRKISISPYLVNLLRRYQLEQTKDRFTLGDKWIDEGWLFTQWDGSVIHPHTPTRQFTKFLKKNNIPHRKLHALRHTSATFLLSSGADIKTVASRLGHTQLSTTNRYVHALRDADEAAAQTFESLLNTPNRPPEKEQIGHA